VVINGKEYAYGGHDHPGVTGVYWTEPKTEPPGGTFKVEILHGFTLASEEEIEAAIRSVSDEFMGTSYNLLTKNCNHFTARLCQKLTGTSSPGWLNRAASIGIAMPCIVPRDWIAPPEYDTADGALLQDYDDGADEEARMPATNGGQRRSQRASRDSSGRILPQSERAPA
jgi:deubiquitinase DESI2